MSASSQSGWRILRQSVKGASRALFPLVSGFWLLASPTAWALVDANNNGLSDLWEREYNNGGLFSETFDPQDDADGDGKINIDEATAGTNPLNGIPPEGFIQANTTHIPAVWNDLDGDEIPDLVSPEAITVSWLTIPGKQYTLLYSADLSLGSWLPVEAPFVASGEIAEFVFTLPGADKLFYRVGVNDIDEDGDGFSSYEEWLAGTDPYEADRDADGLPDWWEDYHGFDPNDDGRVDPNNGPNGDPDGDGFNNLAEYLANTDPHVADSDADGLPDNWELENGFDPFESDENNNGIPDGQDDNDGDGVSNADEMNDGSNPSDGNDFAPQVIEISKAAWGNSNITPYDPPSDPYSGQYRLSASWTDSGASYHVVHDAAINPGYLAPILETVAFPATPPTPPADKPWLVQTRKLSKANIFSRSRVNSPPSGSLIDTSLGASRVWIKVPPSESEQRFHFVRAKDMSLYSWTTKLHTTEFISAEVIEMVVPANQSLSAPIDLIHVPAPVADCDLTSFTRLVPVEVLVPKLDNQGNQINGEFDTASELKVAKWEDAFEGTGTNGSVKDDFIAWDKDRFYIRVPASLNATSIEIATCDNPDPEYNDSPTEIDLIPGSGYSLTDSMILVADDDDDDYAGSGAGADDQKNDRTHKVQLGGNLLLKSITINGTKHELGQKLSVPAKKQVDINFYRFDFPDSATEQSIRDSIKWVKERYAQVGLKINDAYMDIAWPSINGTEGAGQMAIYYNYAEDKSLRQVYYDFIDNVPNGGICVYNVKYAYNSAGIAVTMKQIAHEEEIELKYLNKAFVHSFVSSYSNPWTTAHEILHVLAPKLEGDDHDESFSNILAEPVANPHTDHLGRKRINSEQQNRIYNHLYVEDLE